VYEVEHFERALTAAERVDVDAYLSERYSFEGAS
jgi:hypothetical protein